MDSMIGKASAPGRRPMAGPMAAIYAVALLLAVCLALLAAPGAAHAAETLPDGTYELQARMMNAADPYQESMADAAVVKPVEVTVEGGDCTARVNLRPIQRELGTVAFTGYLRYLRYWDGAAYRDTSVLSTYDAVDTYNRAADGSAAYRYPERVAFPLVNGTAGDDADGFVHLQVYVPVMAAINPSSGTQPVLMQLDWPAKHKESLAKLASAISAARKIPAASRSKALSDALASADSIAKASGSAFWDYDAADAALTKAVSSQQTTKKTAGIAKGKSAKADGAAYRVTSNGKGAKATATLTKGANKKSATVPATVRLNGKVYRVTAVGAKAFAKAGKARTVTVGKYMSKLSDGAFKGSKVSKLVIKSKKLTAKKSIKGSLKGSKVKTVKVDVGSAKTDRKYVKKYKKVFVKANCGKKVKVTR